MISNSGNVQVGVLTVRNLSPIHHQEIWYPVAAVHSGKGPLWAGHCVIAPLTTVEIVTEDGYEQLAANFHSANTNLRIEVSKDYVPPEELKAVKIPLHKEPPPDPREHVHLVHGVRAPGTSRARRNGVILERPPGP